jgi:uncharacterized protein DUF1843
MTVMVYSPAIRDAIKGGDIREMKLLLRQAKKIQAEQGDLPAAIRKLESALKKLTE